MKHMISSLLLASLLSCSNQTSTTPCSKNPEATLLLVAFDPTSAQASEPIHLSQEDAKRICRVMSSAKVGQSHQQNIVAPQPSISSRLGLTILDACAQTYYIHDDLNVSGYELSTSSKRALYQILSNYTDYFKEPKK